MSTPRSPQSIIRKFTAAPPACQDAQREVQANAARSMPGKIHRLNVFGLLLALLTVGCGQQVFETLAFAPAKKLARQETPCPYFEQSGENCADFDFKEIFFRSLDQETMLQALWLTNPNSDKVIVYFHGNGGHVYIRVPHLIKLSEMANVFLPSYRGYGKSEGKPSEAGVYQDAEAALKYVREQLGFKEANTYLYGRSLGAAVTIEVAQRQEYAGLILITPFLSGKAMAKKVWLGWYPGLGRPFDSVRKVQNIKAPALFVHGTRDKVVPFKQGRALYETYPSPNKTFKTIEGGNHRLPGTTAEDEYWKWVGDFVAGRDG